MLNEQTKDRFKQLAGILSEEIQLVSSSTQGRSDSGTLGFFIEQYLLNLTSTIINSIKEKSGNIEIARDATKIFENSLVVKFKIQKQEFLLTAVVSFEQNANTSVSLTHDGRTEKFNLNSKHNSNDIKLFIQEILNKL